MPGDSRRKAERSQLTIPTIVRCAKARSSTPCSSSRAPQGHYEITREIVEVGPACVGGKTAGSDSSPGAGSGRRSGEGRRSRAGGFQLSVYGGCAPGAGTHRLRRILDTAVRGGALVAGRQGRKPLRRTLPLPRHRPARLPGRRLGRDACPQGGGGRLLLLSRDLRRSRMYGDARGEQQHVHRRDLVSDRLARQVRVAQLRRIRGVDPDSREGGRKEGGRACRWRSYNSMGASWQPTAARELPARALGIRSRIEAVRRHRSQGG